MASKTDDFIHGMADYLVDLNYRGERSKLAEAKEEKASQREEIKNQFTEKDKEKASAGPQKPSESGQASLKTGPSNLKPQGQPSNAQAAPQEPQQMKASASNDQLKSILKEKGPKTETQMSGVFSGLSNKKDAKVTLDHVKRTNPPPEEKRVTIQTPAPSFSQPNPQEAASKLQQSATPALQKSTQPFFNSKLAYLDEEDDPLDSKLGSRSQKRQPICR